MRPGGYLEFVTRERRSTAGLQPVLTGISMSSRPAPPNTAFHLPQDGAIDSLPLLREIARQLDGLRYGSIEIVVHEGHVTQIERREKVRVTPSPSTTRS